MTQKFIDRIFIEIDNNSTRLEKLAKIVYTNSTDIGFLKKLLIIIISFIIVTSLGVIYKTTTTINKENKEINLILHDSHGNIYTTKKGDKINETVK